MQRAITITTTTTSRMTATAGRLCGLTRPLRPSSALLSGFTASVGTASRTLRPSAALRSSSRCYASLTGTPPTPPPTTTTSLTLPPTPYILCNAGAGALYWGEGALTALVLLLRSCLSSRSEGASRRRAAQGPVPPGHRRPRA
jgi:hypothetical protein